MTAARRRIFALLAALVLVRAPAPAGGATPAGAVAAEKLLPPDTLLVVTAPDLPKLKEAYKKSAQGRLWNDPSLKPFRDKFLERWDEALLKPLQRELDFDLEKFWGLIKGQFTFAVLANASPAGAEQGAGYVWLADAGDKSAELKKVLGELTKSWRQWGRSSHAEKVREYEFTVLSLTGKDTPKVLRRFLPRQMELQEIGAEASPPAKAADPELVIGQAGSLLIIANSVTAAEKVVVRLAGGAIPSLADETGYERVRLASFRQAPLYGWVNGKALITNLGKTRSGSAPPGPVDTIRPETLLEASGLAAISSVAAAVQFSEEGLLFQVQLAVPDSSRTGLLKMLDGSATEWSAPSFVPADAVKFRRWRIDGQNAWASFEKMMAEISPQWLGSINFIFKTANEAANLTEPGFDIRKNLFGNIGNDLVTYEKKPAGGTPAEMDAAPALYLLASPRPDQFAAALKRLLIFVTAQAESPAERDFLGRKIFSVPLPALRLPTGETKGSGERTLYYAASSSYVALSTDASLVEEFLRSADNPPRPLRQLPGLAEAAQKVGGPGTVLFGFENDPELKRLEFEAWKANPTLATNVLSFGAGSWVALAGFASPEKGMQEWMDLSLLPAFDAVSKYFHFSVHSVSTTTECITLRLFEPIPPELRK